MGTWSNFRDVSKLYSQFNNDYPEENFLLAWNALNNITVQYSTYTYKNILLNNKYDECHCCGCSNKKMFQFSSRLYWADIVKQQTYI